MIILLHCNGYHVIEQLPSTTTRRAVVWRCRQLEAELRVGR